MILGFDSPVIDKRRLTIVEIRLLRFRYLLELQSTLVSLMRRFHLLHATPAEVRLATGARTLHEVTATFLLDPHLESFIIPMDYSILTSHLGQGRVYLSSHWLESSIPLLFPSFQSLARWQLSGRCAPWLQAGQMSSPHWQKMDWGARVAS